MRTTRHGSWSCFHNRRRRAMHRIDSGRRREPAPTHSIRIRTSRSFCLTFFKMVSRPIAQLRFGERVKTAARSDENCCAARVEPLGGCLALLSLATPGPPQVPPLPSLRTGGAATLRGPQIHPPRTSGSTGPARSRAVEAFSEPRSHISRPIVLCTARA